jgi:cell division protein ZapA (FtsZ GTPase activity inhibitor)
LKNKWKRSTYISQDEIILCKPPLLTIERLKKAAKEVNKQFATFKDQFAVEDAVDLLAMTALHFASEDAVHKRTTCNGESESTLSICRSTLGRIVQTNSNASRGLNNQYPWNPHH